MICSSCGAENRSTSKFCSRCGTTLARACPSCGALLLPGAAFCDECGTRVDAAAAPAVTAPPAPAPSRSVAAPPVERRLVSVLFADLVGFTAASEQRDAEEVRELLSRYFETCRHVVGLYGGSIEKFIGDAVMAVWGTPVANEDDAERAVRAALDLVDAVQELGGKVGMAGLHARAGVLTGEAAVTVGAEGQGMVAGDLVNSASRVQAIAEPGCVLVGDATRRVTEAAVLYEDAGEHEVKGKAEPIHVWRALRVAGGIRGSLKTEGLEPPFVGREREMRLIKELFHASAEEAKAHLISVTGIAGIGKSRLAWEFYKHVDGLAQLIYWHRGRCLSYGEGVTYWALAEMVRMRCRIEEGEPPESAAAKLRATLEQFLTNAEERAWAEPRLAHLLGLEESSGWERSDLFGAWRVFFERLAESSPVVLIFEDMQWADTALVDFIEFLLEWSRSHPIFVFTHARPEFLERRPDWGTGKRNFTSLYLEPLSPAAMEALLSGLVPGLPDEVSRQVLERAEGVPLYAVETIRMLLDRGLLQRAGDSYQLTGEVRALEVPESLQGLIAARLDGLTAEERRLVQHASVIGKTFAIEAMVAISEIPAAELEPVLAALVRKELLSIQADPRSPERGQYGFLQDLVRRIAYETLSHRERRTLHIRAAEYLAARSGEDDDIAQVIASHYLEAYRSVPNAEDADELKGRALSQLARAGERAASLAAPEEAQRYFEQAAELADGGPQGAELLERAGQMAEQRGRGQEAVELWGRAIELFSSEGDIESAGRVAARAGVIEWRLGDMDAAITRMEAALARLPKGSPTAATAMLATELGRVYTFRGDVDRSVELLELGLAQAEALALNEVVAEGLDSKSIYYIINARPREAEALVRHAVRLAEQAGSGRAELRARGNLSDTLQRADRFADALEQLTIAQDLAQRLAERTFMDFLWSERAYVLTQVGDWDAAMEAWAEVTPGSSAPIGGITAVVDILAQRGQPEAARSAWAEYADRYRDRSDVQDQALFATAESAVLLAEGRLEEALAGFERLLAAQSSLLGAQAQAGFVGIGEVALARDDLPVLEELVARADSQLPGLIGPYTRAHAERFRARAQARRGEDAEASFRAAEVLFRQVGARFWHAVARLEHGRWLQSRGAAEQARPLIEEARAVFEQLRATLWLQRAAEALATSV